MTGGGGGIAEVVDEILSHDPNAAGLAINWRFFGSNGQEKADYSKGVLERFTRRDTNENSHIKTIANPRKINFSLNPHYAIYFEGFYAINEKGGIVQGAFSEPASGEKIAINHYHTKSLEEYLKKFERGDADNLKVTKYRRECFDMNAGNEEFDDGILKYRAERVKTFRPPDMAHADERLFSALASNLSPTLVPTTPPQFYAGKMETFLTCRAVAAYLQTKIPDDVPIKFFEEASLKAILRTLASGGMTFADARLLIRELPNLLRLPYPAVKDLRNAALQIIPRIMDIMRLNRMWKDYAELDYTQDLLKLI